MDSTHMYLSNSSPLPQAIFAAASLAARGPQIGNPNEVYEKQDRRTKSGPASGFVNQSP